MSRLIDADALIMNTLFNPNHAPIIRRQDVQNAPTIEAEPVRHGKWFDAMVGELPVQVCDQCSTFFPLAYTGGGHHYCPNCGAKMDGEE